MTRTFVAVDDWLSSRCTCGQLSSVHGLATMTCPDGYVAFYAGRRMDIYALSSYAAQLQAIGFFNPPKSKRHLVSVTLAERGGKQVTHAAVD